MSKFIKAKAFLQHLFDHARLADEAAVIVEATLAAGSPRFSEIAQHMPGREAANYKLIQRFVTQVDGKALLLRLFRADAPFVIADPTEMPLDWLRDAGGWSSPRSASLSPMPLRYVVAARVANAGVRV